MCYLLYNFRHKLTFKGCFWWRSIRSFCSCLYTSLPEGHSIYTHPFLSIQIFLNTHTKKINPNIFDSLHTPIIPHIPSNVNHTHTPPLTHTHPWDPFHTHPSENPSHTHTHLSHSPPFLSKSFIHPFVSLKFWHHWSFAIEGHWRTLKFSHFRLVYIDYNLLIPILFVM